MGLKSKFFFLLYCIIFVFLLIATDRFVFGKLFFLVPNHLEWDTSPWYNFLYKRKEIQFSKEQQGILIVGSSVALYSVLPQKIEENLNSKEKSFKVEFYSHVALSPTDFYYYLNDILLKNPQYIVYLLNPADLQFDHIKGTKNLFFSEKERELIYPQRALVKKIYPFEYLRDNLKNLSKNNFLLLLNKSLFLVNRYKSFVKDPFDAYIERVLRSGRSYHYYTGIVPKEGIWLKGWTTPNFTIHCEKSLEAESIFIYQPNTTLSILNEKEELIFQKTFSRKSWYKLNFESKTNYSFYKFKIHPTISSKEIEPHLYIKKYNWGIRLSQNFCKKKQQTNIAYHRISSLDDSRFLDMSKNKYETTYYKRLYPKYDKGNFLARLKMIRETKIKLNQSRFFTWSEMEFIPKIAKILKKNQIKFILINNPENPLELSLYQNGSWYLGYLNFLKNLQKHQMLRFFNRNTFLKDPRYFMDPHHLTYHGAEFFSKEMVKILKNDL